MNIANDFFYTAWGQEPAISVSESDPEDFCEHLLQDERELFCDQAAILLTLGADNSRQYLQLDEVLKALKYFSSSGEQAESGLSEVYACQYRLIACLTHRGDSSVTKAIGQRIDRLRKASVIGYDTARKLISILTLIPQRPSLKSMESVESPPPEVRDGETFFARERHRLEAGIRALFDVLESASLKERAANVLRKMDEERFSIGITGVMNAGKSTLLNALLGAEVLGTSVVPETANLTVIKYAKEPKAIVNFWNQKEWHRIEESAEAMESMRHFVTETREHFGTTLEVYVTAAGRSEKVAISALPSYTSAEHSDKRCNLVKSVELYHDLAFVRGGVEIVDTPGLDDPVIQREEITRSYLLECDLLCHLMNVGQSATQKDVAFIVESLLYRNVAQLLIVITRIDTVSPEELDEVIAYTRSSIKSRLEALGQGRAFDRLIARISFIPIAGRMALLHRTGRGAEALAAGYDLERSGIPRIEAYLKDLLFGDNAARASLLLESVRKEVRTLIEAQAKAFEDEIRLLGKSREEIEALYVAYREEKQQTEERVRLLKKKIAKSKEELLGQFPVLHRMATHKLQSLQSLLKRRIMDDVAYEKSKHKRKPKPERIATMIEIGIRDGFLDMLREYRHAFGKRMDEELERLVRDYAVFAMEERAPVESAQDFFGHHFDALMLTGSLEPLIAQVNRTIARTSSKKTEELDGRLEAALKEAIGRLEETFHERTTEVNARLLDAFASQCRAPLAQVEGTLRDQEKRLANAVRLAGEDRADLHRRVEELATKMKQLARMKSAWDGERE